MAFFSSCVLSLLAASLVWSGLTATGKDSYIGATISNSLGILSALIAMGLSYWLPVPRRWWIRGVNCSVLLAVVGCYAFVAWKNSHTWMVEFGNWDIETILIDVVEGLPSGVEHGIAIPRNELISLEQSNNPLPSTLRLTWHLENSPLQTSVTDEIPVPKRPDIASFWICRCAARTEPGAHTGSTYTDTLRLSERGLHGRHTDKGGHPSATAPVVRGNYPTL